MGRGGEKNNSDGVEMRMIYFTVSFSRARRRNYHQQQHNIIILTE